MKIKRTKHLALSQLPIFTLFLVMWAILPLYGQNSMIWKIGLEAQILSAFDTLALQLTITENS